MERIRALETVLSAQGERFGQIFVMTSGMEAIATGVCAALNADDYLLSTHRTQAHGIAKGLAMDKMLAEILYKATGYMGGVGGRQHMAVLGLGFFGGTGIVGANVPIAGGVALTCKMRKRGQVAACILGDGATTTGAFHEGLGIAALWDLPVVYVIENNQYAMGTSIERSSSETHLYKRGASFRIPGEEVDGMDVLAVKAAAAKAAEHARAGNGPYILEMKTYRYRGHSMSDPAKYRTREEVDAVRKTRDPIDHAEELLEKNGWADEAALKAIDAEVKKIVADAAEFARTSPEPDPKELYTDVYTEAQA
jgi:pyruvate dehydrogenase E1 component alpha subunit